MKKSKASTIPKPESLVLTIKADLYAKIIDVIKSRNISNRDLEKILNVPQPRVSELMTAKLSIMSIEKLLTYLEKLDVAITLSFGK
jgi:predicted XRE-type DNA-binding protein